MSKELIIVALIVIVGLSGFIVFQNRNHTKLPQGKTITLDEFNEKNKRQEPNELVTDKNTPREMEDTTKERQKTSKRGIFVTDGVKHSVSLSEIRPGGPPKDGIPSIDDPKYISIKEAQEFLDDTEPGLSFSRGGVARFYPFQILVWHEIVNDVIGGERALITYCPLCISGVVFDPLVDGERVEFGTSGMLWNSNLVMYDRKTDSLWSQILGEAILGEQTGVVLTILPSDQMRFGEWRKRFPNGEVLSREQGSYRSYGHDPYGDYYTDNNNLIFRPDNLDDRLNNKDFILGVVIDGKAKAYLSNTIKEKGEVVDTFAGRELVLTYEKELRVVRIFEKKESGELVRINPLPSFWFSWVAAHPETLVFK